MTRTMTTSDGVKLTTASTRRYVLFTIREGKATVLRRSDKNGPCFAERRAYFNRGGRCRTVIVDFVGFDGTPRILSDEG
jgi:hypothetical protein